ncbi:ketopantoate reductase family protein [Methanoregula sp.]|uniref:ketopantoate reductase family protein n=1 Tax=Methanoregula sp. TaxID=2052170 RepID=UPI002C8FB129|nr:ketopantoate reductase family protein [Methanoregula sp.]HVP97324.1 ketopantoate reductase family protein [Methanoregula sp.]
MKILVLGAGAVGLSVAAKLSTACEVHAVSRKKNADSVRAAGFSLSGIWGTETFRFSISDCVPRDARYDYIIITAKSQDTESLCREYAAIIRDTETVSLQNGIGNEEIIARYTDRVIGGMIITGFEWRADNKVHVSVEAGPAKLGRFPEGFDEPVRRLVSLMAQAGIRVEGTSEIRSELWGKTLYNCALNPLGAVMGVPYGELARPAAWRIITRIVSEGFAVIHAEGIRLPWATADEYLQYLHDVQLPATAQHHSSMLQDLSRGRRTEIDFLNGAVVAKGAAHGIPTPVNACISDLVKFREALASKGAHP